MEEVKKLRKLCQAMKKDELLCVTNRLLTSASHRDKELIRSLLKDSTRKILPSQQTAFSSEKELIHSLRYARQGSPLVELHADIIAIVRRYEELQGGLNSRDIILHLNTLERQRGKEGVLYMNDVMPMSGIPTEYKKTLKDLLILAGFEVVTKYLKSAGRTERVWISKEGYKHLSVYELAERLKNKLEEGDQDDDNQT